MSQIVRFVWPCWEVEPYLTMLFFAPSDGQVMLKVNKIAVNSLEDTLGECGVIKRLYLLLYQ